MFQLLINQDIKMFTFNCMMKNKKYIKYYVNLY